MIEFDQQAVALSTGVTLNVATVGPRDGEPIVFLHGFPESHRTWRHQIAALSDRHFCIAPDQRGFGKSDKPQEVERYTTDKLIADIFALADAFDIDRFTLAGHDWGGAIAWGAALGRPDRVARLIIANAPHPFLFRKALIEDPEQRAASQYMRAFRDTANDPFIAEHGLAAFLARTLEWNRSPALEQEELAIYMRDWAEPGAPIAMLNWYRAAQIEVPAPDEEVPPPASDESPPIRVPTLVIWAMDDKALLPGQLRGLDRYVPDLTLVEVPDTGHFVTWEAPDAVNAAFEDFLAAKPIA